MAAAQFTPGAPTFGSNGVFQEDAATRLARYLRMVTANPRDLEALSGAGRAALDVGDAQAAIGFFARAESISPRNGRVKAGLGSALVLLNQEQAALRYFDDAVSLGVPEAEIAGDRGLAHDLRGSTKRAQRDYQVALGRSANAETTRRMALSLAIGGERDAALATLEPLLRRQDTAAWRARAFILAMTGDTAGANRAAETAMNASSAAGFAPFFRKLPTLRPGEKAAAVHFGNFPGEGRPMRIDDLFNQAEVAARVALENTPRSALDAGAVDPGQSAFGRGSVRVADAEGQLPAVLAPRRYVAPVATISTPRPNGVLPTARATPTVQAPVTKSVPTSRPTPVRSPTPAPSPAPAPSQASGTTARVPVAANASPAPGFAGTSSRPPLASNPQPAVVTRTLSPARTPSPAPVPSPAPAATTAPPASTPAPEPSRLADISATVREIARDSQVRSADLPPSQAPASAVTPVAVEPAAAQLVTVPPVGVDIVATTSAPVPSLLPSVLSPTPTAGPVPGPERLAGPSAATSATVPPLGPPPPAPRPKVETTVSSAPPASRPKVETAAKPAEADATGGDGSRIWVQIAGGADEKLFPGEWRRLRGKAPDLLTPHTPWTTPLKATNRLLVGPFTSQREAQDFVNKLAPKGITAFAWTSATGQAIAKLATR